MFNLVNRAKKKNNKGFSLVELIVVVLIIAIIAVALAPQVMKYVGSARTGTDANNAASIKSSVQAAVADYQAAGGTSTSAAGVYKLVPNTAGDGTGSVSIVSGGDAAVKTNIENTTGKDIPKINDSSKKSWKVTIDANAGVKVEADTAE